MFLLDQCFKFNGSIRWSGNITGLIPAEDVVEAIIGQQILADIFSFSSQFHRASEGKIADSLKKLLNNILLECLEVKPLILFVWKMLGT